MITICTNRKCYSWQLSPSPIFSHKQIAEHTKPAVLVLLHDNYSQHDTPCRLVVTTFQAAFDRSLADNPTQYHWVSKSYMSLQERN